MATASVIVSPTSVAVCISSGNASTLLVVVSITLVSMGTAFLIVVTASLIVVTATLIEITASLIVVTASLIVVTPSVIAITVQINDYEHCISIIYDMSGGGVDISDTASVMKGMCSYQLLV